MTRRRLLAAAGKSGARQRRAGSVRHPGPGRRVYAYTTQANFGAVFVNVPTLRSTDLVSWELVSNAIPDNADWAVASPGDMWARHITRWDDGRYRHYFSAARRAVAEMAIGVATADSPEARSPTPKGRSSPAKALSAIDPFVLRTDDGSHYLYWGSADEPISAGRLSADGLPLEGDPVEILPCSTGQ